MMTRFVPERRVVRRRVRYAACRSRRGETGSRSFGVCATLLRDVSFTSLHFLLIVLAQ